MRNGKSIFILGLLGLLVILGCNNTTTTPPVIDTTPPQWDSTIGVQSFEPGDGEVTIHWGTATDSQTTVLYQIYLDTDDNPWDTIPYLTENISYVVKGLSNGTIYWVGVRVQDRADPPNVDTNDIFIEVTPAIPDNEPPVWDTEEGIVSVSAWSGTVSIEWGTATDEKNNPVEYLLYMDYDSDPWDATPVSVYATDQYIFTGLKNSKTYWFGVRCQDSFIKPNADENDVVLSATLCAGVFPAVPNHILDLTDFTNIVDFVPFNEFVYLLDDDGLFTILDMTDPINPSTTGSLMLGKHDEDSIDVQGDYAYISAEIIYVINISDPSTPVIEGSIDTEMGKIEVQGNYLYGIFPPNGGTSSGLKILDVSDPSGPYVSSLIPLAYAMGGPNYSNVINQTVSGNYAYVLTFQSFIASSTIGNTLFIVDVSNPDKLLTTGNLFLESIDATRPHVDGDYISLYIESKDGFGNGIKVINISDPANPTDANFIITCETETNLEVYCDYAYQLCNESVRVVDMRDPLDMSVYTSIELDGMNATMVKIDSGYAYIAHSLDGLLIFNLW